MNYYSWYDINWWTKEKVLNAVSGNDEDLFIRLIMMEQYQEREHGRSVVQVISLINNK